MEMTIKNLNFLFLLLNLRGLQIYAWFVSLHDTNAITTDRASALVRQDNPLIVIIYQFQLTVSLPEASIKSIIVFLDFIKPQCVTIQMKATEQYFRAVLFVFPYPAKLNLRFFSILRFDTLGSERVKTHLQKNTLIYLLQSETPTNSVLLSLLTSLIIIRLLIKCLIFI